jgi:hypothetical protein
VFQYTMHLNFWYQIFFFLIICCFILFFLFWVAGFVLFSLLIKFWVASIKSISLPTSLKLNFMAE